MASKTSSTVTFVGECELDVRALRAACPGAHVMLLDDFMKGPRLPGPAVLCQVTTVEATPAGSTGVALVTDLSESKKNQQTTVYNEVLSRIESSPFVQQEWKESSIKFNNMFMRLLAFRKFDLGELGMTLWDGFETWAETWIRRHTDPDDFLTKAKITAAVEEGFVVLRPSPGGGEDAFLAPELARILLWKVEQDGEYTAKLRMIAEAFGITNVTDHESDTSVRMFFAYMGKTPAYCVNCMTAQFDCVEKCRALVAWVAKLFDERA